jgi:hypothetical protein
MSQICYAQNDQENTEYFLRMADALARQTSQLQFSANHHWLQGRTAALSDDIEKAETYFLSAVEVGQHSGAYFAVLAGQAGLTKLYLQSGFFDLSSKQAAAALETLTRTYELTNTDHNTRLFDVDADLFEPAITAFSEIGDLASMLRTCELKKAFKLYRDLISVRHTLQRDGIDSLRLQFVQTQWQIRTRWRQLRRQWKVDRRDQLEDLIETKQGIAELEQTRSEILQTIAQTHPQYLDFFMPNTLSLAQLRDRLEQLEATYVNYFLGENSTFITVVTPDDIHCKRVNLTQNYLSSIVRQISPSLISSGSETPSASREAHDTFNISLCGELYDYLIAPVRAWLRDGTTLIFSPDDVLNSVPFECLVTNPMALTDDFDYRHARYLIEEFALTYVPYAGFLRNYTRMQARHADGLMLSMAVLPSQSRGRQVVASDAMLKRRVENMQNAVGGESSKLYIGGQATQSVFLSESSKYQLLYLMLPTRFDALSSANLEVSFADAEADPCALDLFYETKLNTELLVFETADSSLGAQSNLMWVSGMLHALNFAGVENLVTHVWKHSPEEKEHLLVAFLSSLEIGTTAAVAMQQAKRTLLQSGNRNPYYWNAMFIYGPPVDIILRPTSNWELLSITVLAVLILVSVVVLKTRQLRRDTT